SDTNFYLYEVQQGETLYALSERFEVTVPQLISNNKNLRYGLKYGTILRIPKTRGILVTQQVKSDSTIELGVEKLTCLQCDSIRDNSKVNNVKVAVLLPFMASKFLNDEKIYQIRKDTMPENVVLSEPRYDDRFLEFYEGLLLSIDSLKNTGKNITLFTYDTKKDTSFMDTILSELNILSPDIVFGPIYPNLVKKVSEHCNKKGWMHVLPFSRGAVEEINHPTSIHGILPADIELEKISAYLASNTSGLYYLVYKNNERDSLKAAVVDSLITSKKLANGDTVKIYHIKDFENLEQELSSKFDSAIQKLVIPISTSFNQPEVVSIYSTLNNLALTSDITVIGHFSWQGYSSLRVEPFHRFNTILLTPFHLNYNHDLFGQLIQKCKDLYRYEPHQLISNGLGLNFTYYGYEIGLSLIGAYYDFTLDMLHCMPCYKTDLMQSSYKFVPFRNGYGYYNSSYTILKYADDFTVNVIDVN
ncbi:MAG: LysM peptidoglycan-binding domain-containing protein, partial [Bacteroidales bacterium]|nr:LysM peptidoglycan-binding domain-containing protein [Bacteroidales bacterium]